MAFKTFLSCISTRFSTSDPKKNAVKEKESTASPPALDQRPSEIHTPPHCVDPSLHGALAICDASAYSDADVHVRMVIDSNGEVTLCKVESLKLSDTHKEPISDKLCAPVSIAGCFASSTSEAIYNSPELCNASSLPKFDFLRPYHPTQSCSATLDISDSISATQQPIPLTLDSLLSSPSTPSTLFAEAPTSSHTHPCHKTKLKLDEFEPIKQIGKGGHGLIYLVTHKDTSSSLALKAIRKAHTRSKSINRVFEEQDIMKSLTGNPWFLSLEGSFQDTENFFLLTKYHSRGDLQSLIWEHGKIKPSLARQYAAEMIHALDLLHTERICHRDIKPENILIDDHDHLVLADFGIAKAFGRCNPWVPYDDWHHKEDIFVSSQCLSERDTTRSRCGTPGYTAPEVTRGYYSYEVDIWSAGVTLYEMLMGRLPFGIKPSEQNVREVLHRSASLPISFGVGNEVDANAQNLIRKMLAKDPKHRPTIAEMKQHPYFASIDWPKIARREPPRKTGGTGIPRSGQHKIVRDVRIPCGEPYDGDDAVFPWFEWISPTLRGLGDTDVPGQASALAMKRSITNLTSKWTNDSDWQPAWKAIQHVKRWWRKPNISIQKSATKRMVNLH